MTLKETFDKAVTDSKQLTARPDNDTLLRIYSLYKQAMEGDAPDAGPSNPFDFVGKAKYDAWESLQGTSADDAMTKYVELIETLKKG